MRRVAFSWLAIAVIAGVACLDNPISPHTFTIEKTPTNSGDLQRDTVLATLAPLRVLVRADGRAMSGIPVTWIVLAAGTAATTVTSTDVSGIAILSFKLGARAAEYTVQAVLEQTNAPRTNFIIRADPGRPSVFRIVSGADQTDTTMAELAAEYVVQVSDNHGNNVVGLAIDWAVTAGGGSVSPARSVTSPNGYASTRHTLGASPGVQTVSGSALSTAPVTTFTSTAIIPPPPPADGYLPMAIEMTVGGNTDVYRVNANGTDLTRLTTSVSVDGRPVWSPDGAKIAFVSNRSGGDEIWVMDADGSAQLQVTTHAAVGSGFTNKLTSAPVWSPDATRIAFTSVSDTSGAFNVDIYVVNLDGSSRRRLTTPARDDYGPTWSPDGRSIAFTSARNGVSEIFVMSAEGSNQRLIASLTAPSWQPVWSPDGLTIAFTSETGGYYGLPDVFVVKPDGSGLRRLVRGGRDAAWSADGAALVFTRIALCGYYQCNWDVAVMKADGSAVSSLTSGGRIIRAGSWSPNGQWISTIETTCMVGGCVDAVKLVRKDGTGFRGLAKASNASWKP